MGRSGRICPSHSFTGSEDADGPGRVSGGGRLGVGCPGIQVGGGIAVSGGVTTLPLLEEGRSSAGDSGMIWGGGGLADPEESLRPEPAGGWKGPGPLVDGNGLP